MNPNGSIRVVFDELGHALGMVGSSPRAGIWVEELKRLTHEDFEEFIYEEYYGYEKQSRTLLGAELRRLREKIIDSGQPQLTWDDIEREGQW